MGCWNETCGFSNLPIKSGEKVMGFILLMHNIDTSYAYPNALGTPFALPITGRYNDHGSIENIKENFNTEYIISKIKEYFTNNKYVIDCDDYYIPKDWDKATIEDVYTLVERGFTVREGKMKSTFASYMVLKNVYDKMTDLSGREDLHIYTQKMTELNDLEDILTMNKNNPLRDVPTDELTEEQKEKLGELQTEMMDGLSTLLHKKDLHIAGNKMSVMFNSFSEVMNGRYFNYAKTYLPKATLDEKDVYVRFASYCHLMMRMRKTWVPMTGKGSQNEDYELFIKLANLTKEHATNKLEEYSY